MIARLITASFLLASFLSASAEAADVPKHDADQLKQAYQTWVENLDHKRVANDYAKAVQKLDSEDSKSVLEGLQTLAATGEPVVMPWIVPFLDAEDAQVRIWAGISLQKIVSNHELRRRDQNQPGKVVIKPRGPDDLDLRPLAWVMLRMLQKADDGNTHAYAATMIGYLGLKEFEPDLRTLLASRHPAVTNAAKYALEMLGATPGFSEQELTAAKVTGEAFAELFRKGDEDSLGLLLLPMDAIGKVLNAKLLKDNKPEALFEKLVTANMGRFREFPDMSADLSKTSTITFQVGHLVRSDFYADEVRVMKNSFVVLTYGNRVEIKIKIEEMVFVNGKCYIVEID